ncbi:SIR2 family protein [Azospirillum sp. TSA2s]|uniref:SIR2 family protein n=1 Tax=Azospirillum sp. TSA2s TaxID=709810 RepID=UPI00145B2EDB|nr:SIR2 family protein [Azospirillum sp. TSA2s]
MADPFRTNTTGRESGAIQFLAEGPRIPLELIQAREAGEVVFLVGAGASRRSGFAGFKDLTRNVYWQLTGKDPAVEGQVPGPEHEAFQRAAYDVALGQLEARLDGPILLVRDQVARELDADKATGWDIHKDLLRLSRDPAGRPRVITTNFDTLFERAWLEVCGPALPLRSWANAALPQPGVREFTGIMHLHGRLADRRFQPAFEQTELVLTDVDFGDAYLRSGWAARFLYDLVRRYHIVLVGYGAEDPPLKYLLSVIQADRRRFADLKPIYALEQVDGDLTTATATWLAKGITPLLCQADPNWRRLYDNLAEWAAYVEDPERWAQTCFNALGRKSYHEVEEHRRGIMSLLLANSTHCARFKAGGGDFTWIRAIEDHRPSETEGTAAPLLVRPHPYTRSFSIWLSTGLETPAAVTWAIARLTPPRQSPAREMEADDAFSDPQPLGDHTTVYGFSAEELAALNRQVDDQSASLTPRLRDFWSLLTTAAEESRNGNADHYAYTLINRLREIAAAPDLADVPKIARFLRPQLHLSPRRDWIDESDQAPAPFDPLAKVILSHRWNRFPEHRELVAALPPSAGWLQALLRALEAEIDRLYRFDRQYHQANDRDWLSRTLHRVATDPRWPVRGEDREGDADPDLYGAAHAQLVRVLSGAWTRLAEIDGPAAQRVASGWSFREELLFVRLFLHALVRDDLWTGTEVAQALSRVSDESFWFELAEAKTLAVTRWQHLTDRDRQVMEGRLLAGPPLSHCYGQTADDQRTSQRYHAARILDAIAQAGGHLSAPALELIAQTRETMPPDAWEGRSSSTVVRSTMVGDGDAAVFDGLQGPALIAALLRHRNERAIGSSDAALALIKQDPHRVLAALQAAEQPHLTGALWRQLLWRLDEADWLKAATAADRVAVLQAIAALPQEVMIDAAQAATHTVQRLLLSTPGDDDRFLADHQALALDVWRRLLEAALVQPVEEIAFASNQGDRLMQAAVNSLPGDVAFLALLLADRCRKAPETYLTLRAAINGIEVNLLRLTGTRRMLAAARLMQWLSAATKTLPAATETMVVKPLLARETQVENLVFIDLQALYGHPWSADLLRRFEPLLLQEMVGQRLSSQGVARLVGQKTWRVLSRLAKAQEFGPEGGQMRAVLQQTTDQARVTAADTIGRWIQGVPAGERSGFWQDAAKPFLQRIWPFEAALRTPEVSERLGRLPAAFEDKFTDAVDTLRPLLVPFTLWDVGSLFLFTPGSTSPAGAAAWMERFAQDHWVAALELVGDVLGPSPSEVPYNLADWLAALSVQAPQSGQDHRFKRLLRLTQR